GNTRTCPQNVVVTDNIAPNITCPANITQNVDAGTCGASIAVPDPVANDNCAITSTTWTMAGVTTGSGTNYIGTKTFNVGVTTITYTVKDAANNQTTCSFTVTVIDNIAPTIICPSNISTVTAANACNASVITPNPVTADNCLVTTLTWALTGATTATSPTTGVNNLGTYTFNTGLTTVTYTVKDAAGNTATCNYTVLVVDNVKPNFTCPATVNVAANANCNATGVNLGTPTATDNCPGSIAIVNNAPSVFPIGTTVVTWTASDASGNTATCTQNVIVTDGTAPTISCPNNISQGVSSGSCDASVVVPDPTTADNCGVTTVTWTMTGATTGTSVSSGINYVGTKTFNVGVTTITYTVKDAAGNQQTCSFTITILENSPPTITCPPNVTVNAPANACNASLATTDPVIADNCGTAGLTLTWTMAGAPTANS